MVADMDCGAFGVDVSRGSILAVVSRNSFFGIRPAEIRELFPGCQIQFRKITLAPPIARKLAPVSWGLCYLLESLKIFNTHYLAAIRPLLPAP